MLKGSIVALITPFKDDSLDEENYIKLIDYHLKNGTNGIVPGGTTGESPTLSHNEHKKIIEIAGLNVEVQPTSAGLFNRNAKVSDNETATTLKINQLGYDNLPFWKESLEKYINTYLSDWLSVKKEQ